MKGIPLRNWGRGTGSYDPRTGRQSSAFVGGATTIEGEQISPSSQVDTAQGQADTGTPSLAEIDARRSHKRGR
jgi:hypothetical protein